MALVGVIDAGTVETIVRSIVRAKSTVLLLLDREGEQAQFFIEGGVLQSARAGDLAGDDALRYCTAWDSGFYRLIRSSDDMAHPAGLHALVVNADRAEGREWEAALADRGFRTSVLPYQGAVPALVRLLAPDVILMPCPCLGDRIRCQHLRQGLSQDVRRAPVIVTVVGADRRCDEPGELCLFGPLDRAALYRLLAHHLSQSPSGSFQAAEDDGARKRRSRTLPGTGAEE